MYLAVVTILFGEAVFFVSTPVLIEAGVFIVLANVEAVVVICRNQSKAENT